MISKSQIKLIKSLNQKKFRFIHRLFFAEGVKTINELLLSNFKLNHLYSSTLDFNVSDDLLTIISANELHKISALKNPNKALAIFEMPKEQHLDFERLIVALDNIRDPGNLGTIIRLCDWFGVKDLICSNETVDCYNPKVVQATMGSIARVNIVYKDLKSVLKDQTSLSFGGFMDGENIYEMNLPKKGILVLGNEANGIQHDVESLIATRVAIPRFGDVQETESLNVANAASILLSEFRRRY